MGILSHLFYPWGLLLQGLAIVHFIRRRPDTYWIFVILFLGPIGATIYLFVEALPDIGLVGHSFKGFSRRKRIGQLQSQFETTRLQEITRSWATFFWRKANSSRREMHMTGP